MEREHPTGRVLVVEDEPEIAELLVAYLERAGFEVARAWAVPDAIRVHGQFRPDLILLDVGLPGGGDGIEVLTTIRRRFDTPIIMVTALDDAVTKLTSLRMGADDYVVKPFNPSEVVERARAVLRRVYGHSARRTLHIGGLLVDLDARTVSCSGLSADGPANVRILLTPTEFELLAHMARQPRRAFRRSELLHAASPDSDAFDRVVDSHLSKLRNKLAAAGCRLPQHDRARAGHRISLMAWLLNRIVTRMWLLAGLMTVITLVVGVSAFYIAVHYALYDLTTQMPPGAKAELNHLIATGRTGTDRFYEIYDRYGGMTIETGDLRFIAFIALLSTAVGGSIAFVFARRISRPITAVAAAAAKVSAGDRSIRVERGTSSGEVGDLIDSFNTMAADIQAYERERTVLTAGIAHELRTPLTILKGRLHGLVDGVIRPESGEAGRLLRQVEQLSRIVEDLRTLAHADEGGLHLDLRSVDPGEIVKAAVADLREAALATEVAFAERYEPALVHVDPVRLTQIVTNLLTNAVKHSPAGGVVSVDVETVDGRSVIRVADEGAGFSREDESRLFIPFWRSESTRRAGQPGSGLGLALAEALANAMGSRIRAENRSDRTGAQFSVSFPRRSWRGAASAAGTISSELDGASTISRQ